MTLPRGKPEVNSAILEHCLAEFASITPLIGKVAESSTLYRYKDLLLKNGMLESDGRDSYRTTSAGRLELESIRGRSPTGLSTVYPPLRRVPTQHHRAIIELGFAAVVARKYDLRTDRHPALILAGTTLAWKTSSGIFLCHMLGLNPGRQVVNLAAESGKSLFLRKASTGKVTYKRELLDTDLVVYDEFQAADSQTKRFLSVVIDGRKTIGFENEELIIHPVPFLTLNPTEGSTLEERLGLSTPQLRRSIIGDLTKVAVPDLALKGEEILVEAKSHGALPFRKPRADCSRFREKAYSLFTSCLNPRGLELVDFEMLLMLSSAMTSFLEPMEALRLVFYDALLLFETLDWTQPGWVSLVNAFPMGPEHPSVKQRPTDTEVPSPETKIKAFKLLDAGGSTTKLVTSLHITIDEAESVVKEYVEINSGDLKLSELRRKKAEQELPFDIDARLTNLSSTIDDHGQWKQEHCTFLSNNYCMYWRYDEKPDISDQIGDPLEKGGEWYVHPTYARCALCPGYLERNATSVEKVARSVKRLGREFDAHTSEDFDTRMKLDELLTEVEQKGNFKMKNCRRCDATGVCRAWTYTLEDGSKVNRKPTTRQCALCPAFSQRQQQ